MNKREKLIDLMNKGGKEIALMALTADIDDAIDMPSAEEYIANYILAHGADIFDDNPTTIDLSDDFFGCVLNCAIRYCLGRESYMPGLVIDVITPLLPELCDKTLWCLERDIREAGNWGGYGNETIDKPKWMRFLADIRAEQKRRETNGWATQ